MASIMLQSIDDGLKRNHICLNYTVFMGINLAESFLFWLRSDFNQSCPHDIFALLRRVFFFFFFFFNYSHLFPVSSEDVGDSHDGAGSRQQFPTPLFQMITPPPPREEEPLFCKCFNLFSINLKMT